jgi:Transposase DDE domain
MYKRISEDKEKIKNLSTSQQFILHQATRYLKPYTEQLYMQMDVRLVRTFFDAFIGIIVHRDKDKGLLLSELGGYIAGFLKAVSGSKRLSNLFRSEKWTHKDIEKQHLAQAKGQVEKWTKEGRRLLGFIDDSQVEKPESWFSEGLCAVYSSKAQRLTRIKKGYYRPPISRVCVPGFEWTALMIGGLSLTPMVGLMTWWTKRGWHGDSQDNVFYKMLKQIKATFGRALTLVLDRGFANEPTLERLFKCQLLFIIRWKTTNLLTNTAGETKNTWRICFGKKGFDKRVVWDKERKQALKLEIIYAPVWHPEHLDKPLTLIVVRAKNRIGQQPMYLLTNSEIDSIGLAWEIFQSYIQRWDVEQAFRFIKSELGIHTIRLHEFVNRLKFMALVMLVYEFLLQIWRNWKEVALVIINTWCPRTDKRMLNTRLPLYRFRDALAKLLLIVLIKFSILGKN